jgi:hypothetical protein
MVNLSPEKALIFRIMHIDNLAWIIEHDICARDAGQVDPNFREIGNPDLIDKRRRRAVSIPPGGTLSDYIPFYFTPYSPMLLNIKTGYNGIPQTPMHDIAICVSSLHKLAEAGVPFVFSDRHAYLATAEFSSELSDLDRVDWALLQSRNFKRDPNDFGKVERYQAEALAYRHVPVDALLGIACHNAGCKTRIDELLESSGKKLSVAVRPDWYF